MRGRRPEVRGDPPRRNRPRAAETQRCDARQRVAPRGQVRKWLRARTRRAAANSAVGQRASAVRRGRLRAAGRWSCWPPVGARGAGTAATAHARQQPLEFRRIAQDDARRESAAGRPPSSDNANDVGRVVEELALALASGAPGSVTSMAYRSDVGTSDGPAPASVLPAFANAPADFSARSSASSA